MLKKNYKGRCHKHHISKCKEICRTYNPLQTKYADLLQENDDIAEIKCNVLLEGLTEGEYTSDFVCTKTNGDLMVRECVYRGKIEKPMTIKLLGMSRDYWLKRGVTDLGIVIDATEE